MKLAFYPTRWPLVWLVLAGCSSLATLASGADQAKWQPLFDGRTLDGWKITNFGGEGDVEVEDGQIILESEDLEADVRGFEVVLRVREDVVTILESPHDVHLGPGFGQALKEGGQPFAAFVGLRIVLDVLRFVNDGDGLGIAGLDAFQQCPDLVFLRDSHD